MTNTQERARDGRYYWPDGSLKWGHPVDVGHLILQLQTLDQAMKVSSISFIDTKEGRKARAYGLSMSRERWDEGGWLNYQLDTPECLAIWANPPDIAAAMAQVEAETWKKVKERDLSEDMELATLAEQFPELNMNNYNESEVERLNDWGIQMVQLLECQQAQRTKEGKG